MGAPEGEFTFVWPDDPFADREVSIGTQLEMLDAGELLPGEVRVAAGWEPFTEEQLRERTERDRQRAQSMQRMMEGMSGNNDNGNDNNGDGNNAPSQDSPN